MINQSFEDGYAKGLADAQKPANYGWLLAVDEALVCSHLGVAELSHSYEYAKAKLNELICWNIQLEKDLSVPTDQQIIDVAKATQTAEPGKDGYILPVSFGRELLKLYGNRKD